MNHAVATFVDKYGDEREIHKTRHGLKLRRNRQTIISKLNPLISKAVGRKIRERRIERGMTLEDLCLKAGLQSVTPKNRMWEIENSIRQHGTRLGTLYAIAAALDVEATTFMPSLKSIFKDAKISQQEVLSIK